MLEGHDEQVQLPAPARSRVGVLREWPMVLVLVGVAGSLAVVALGHFRRGSVLLAGAVVLAMFLRLLLTTEEAGMLAVRSKVVDVVCLAVLGIGLGVLAFAVPPPV